MEKRHLFKNSNILDLAFMLVQEQNTFLKIMLHPVVKKLFCIWKKLYYTLQKENQFWTCQLLVASKI